MKIWREVFLHVQLELESARRAWSLSDTQKHTLCDFLFWLQLFEGEVKLFYDVKQMAISLFLLSVWTENAIVYGV